MIDDTTLMRIGSQLGNLGINLVSLERDIEILQVKLAEETQAKDEAFIKIASLESELEEANNHVKTLQAELSTTTLAAVAV